MCHTNRTFQFYSAIKCTENAEKNFTNTQKLLKDAVYLKQQLKYEENRRLEFLSLLSYNFCYNCYFVIILFICETITETKRTLNQHSKDCLLTLLWTYQTYQML